MNITNELPNLVELHRPIREGDYLAHRRVLEVIRLESTCTLAGYERALFVAVHEKDRVGRMLTMFVLLKGVQAEWAMQSNSTGEKP